MTARAWTENDLNSAGRELLQEAKQAATAEARERRRLTEWIVHIQNYCLNDKYANGSAHINVPGFCEQALNGEDIPAFYKSNER